MADDLRSQREEAGRLLEYIQRLEKAIDAASNAALRNNLQTVLQKQYEQYEKLTAAVKANEAAQRNAAREARRAVGMGVAGAVGQALLPGAPGARAAIGRAVGRVASGARTGRAAGGTAGAAVGGALGAVAGTAGLVVEAFKALFNSANLLQQVLGPFAQMVRYFDPAVAQRFTMSLEDLQAALGSLFTPLVEAGTQFADVLNSVFTDLAPAILPVVAEVAGALKEMATVYLAALQPVLAAFVPLLRQVVEHLRPMTAVVGEMFRQLGGILTDTLALLKPLLDTVLPLLVTGLRAFYNVVSEVIIHVRAAIQTLSHFLSNLSLDNVRQGLQGQGPLSLERLSQVFREAVDAARRPGPGLPTDAQRTFAARPASVIDAETIGRQARVAAFGARGPAEQTADNTQRTAEELTRVRERLDRFSELWWGRRPAEIAREGIERGPT